MSRKFSRNTLSLIIIYNSKQQKKSWCKHYADKIQKKNDKHAKSRKLFFMKCRSNRFSYNTVSLLQTWISNIDKNKNKIWKLKIRRYFRNIQKKRQKFSGGNPHSKFIINSISYFTLYKFNFSLKLFLFSFIRLGSWLIFQLVGCCFFYHFDGHDQCNRFDVIIDTFFWNWTKLSQIRPKAYRENSVIPFSLMLLPPHTWKRF